jgi:hypothetical protein
LAFDCRDWDKALTRLGFERKEEGGGGLCLYYSIAAALGKPDTHDMVKRWLAGAWQSYVNGKGFARCPTLAPADTADLETALIAWAGDVNLHTRSTTSELNGKPLSLLASTRSDFTHVAIDLSMTRHAPVSRGAKKKQAQNTPVRRARGKDEVAQSQVSQGESRKRAQYKCSGCQGTGHTKRSKTCPKNKKGKELSAQLRKAFSEVEKL